MGRQETSARVVPLAEADINTLIALAGEIWRSHYTGIISLAQIDYMLEQRYNAALLRAELQRCDLWWDQLLLDDRMNGFASYFLTGKPGEMKLDKLYVHPSRQRRGYGGMLLDRAIAVARAQACATLSLAVNKNNRNAIAAYERYGFVKADAVVKDIGGGFVMDDFIMVRML